MLRTDGVLFDYGGTLVTFDYPTEELLEVLRSFRSRLEKEAATAVPDAATLLREVLLPLEEHIANPSEDEVDYMKVYGDAWRRVGLPLPEGLLYEILDAEQRCWDRAVRLQPDALPMLAWLGARGIRRGICSNAPFPPEMMHRQLRGNGIAAQVDAAVFSSEVGRRKPAPELYRAALSAIGTAPERTLFIGDRVREDYEGPTALGLRAAILRAHEGDAIPGVIPAITSLADLAALL